MTVTRTATNTEAWRNATEGIVCVSKFNLKGELDHEPVYAGKVVYVTPEERRVNQEMMANDELDFFKNGQLVPVRLIESTDDFLEISSNKNLMSEDDMKKILKLHWKKFDTEIAGITNVITLRRLFEIASNDENVTHRVVSTLQARIAEVGGAAPSQEREVISGPPRPTTT